MLSLGVSRADYASPLDPILETLSRFKTSVFLKCIDNERTKIFCILVAVALDGEAFFFFIDFLSFFI